MFLNLFKSAIFVVAFTIFSINVFSSDLVVKSQITEEKYCSEYMLKLKIKLTFTNEGKLPILLYKHYFVVQNTAISDNLANLDKNIFVSSSESILSGKKIDSKNIENNKKDFTRLELGDSYNAETFDYISINLKNELNREGLVAGKYAVKQIVDVWGENELLGEKLHNKFLKKGILLWTKPIITNPMEFNVTKKPIIQKCN